MLDENLPTFHFKPSSDNPQNSILYFTQSGSEPAAEYVLRRPERADPGARNKYAIALCDPFSPDVVYGEILINPEWSQPTLSAAELRAQQQSSAAPPPQTPILPDAFTILLYNPDVSVPVKMVAGSWSKADSWEFELPVKAFRRPTTSALDREQEEPGTSAAASLAPRLVFRWKKDGRLSKDMTCFMTGKSVGGRRSKEPDITVALFKAAGRGGSAVTVYEPNLQRVEVEDRKGWEVVILLAAEAIKDLWLAPRPDAFNVAGDAASASAAAARKRKESRPPVTTTTPPAGTSMAGALGIVSPSGPGPATYAPPAGPPPSAAATTSAHAVGATPGASSSKTAIDAETRRLQAMVEREERERERRDQAEQKRIKKMLEDEEREQRRRDAEIAKETERLRKQYGVEGQDLPRRDGPAGASPPLPPRSQGGSRVHFGAPPPPAPQGGGYYLGSQPSLPPRPLSAGPAGASSWWRGPGGSGPPPPQPQQQPPPPQGRPRNGSGGLGQNPAARMSTFFGLGGSGGGGGGGGGDDRKKVQKKRSMQW